MGQMLSTPVTSVESETHESRQYRIAVGSMQGWRVNMEDAHVVRVGIGPDQEALMAGVYDGHGGATIAQYVAHNLPARILQHPKFTSNTPEALRQSFMEVDMAMMTDDRLRDDTSGSTAVMVVLINNKIFCANAGDSRAIASRGGVVEQLSFDHKPMNPGEYDRILGAGGWVEFNRVNGNLALSRAFGDFEFKRNSSRAQHEQIVTAVPDVIIKDVSDDLEFIVLACDGIWDVLTMTEVLEFVRGRIAQGLEPVGICTDLLNRCLAPDCTAGGIGCDNMTVILICCLQGQSYNSVITKCRTPPATLASPLNSQPTSRHGIRPSIAMATSRNGNTQSVSSNASVPTSRGSGSQR